MSSFNNKDFFLSGDISFFILKRCVVLLHDIASYSILFVNCLKSRVIHEKFDGDDNNNILSLFSF